MANEERGVECSRCGRRNDAAASRCVGCGQPLSASPYVDAIFSERQPEWSTPPPPSYPAEQPYYPPGATQAGYVNRDEEHLKLLSIFHFVVGGMVGLFACIPIIHLVVGIGLLATSGLSGAKDAPPAFVGILFIVLASIFITLGWTLATCLIFAGKFLKQRRRYTFCLVVAALVCIWMPLGTVLGVFTLVVLNRPSVKALFARSV